MLGMGFRAWLNLQMIEGGDWLVKIAQTSFLRVKVTLIHKATYFYRGSKTKVENSQLTPTMALGYFHTQGLIPLLLST